MFKSRSFSARNVSQLGKEDFDAKFAIASLPLPGAVVVAISQHVIVREVTQQDMRAVDWLDSGIRVVGRLGLVRVFCATLLGAKVNSISRNYKDTVDVTDCL